MQPLIVMSRSKPGVKQNKVAAAQVAAAAHNIITLGQTVWDHARADCGGPGHVLEPCFPATQLS